MSAVFTGVRVGRENRAVAYIEVAQQLKAKGGDRAWSDLAAVFAGLDHAELAAVASSLAFLAAGAR